VFYPVDSGESFRTMMAFLFKLLFISMFTTASRVFVTDVYIYICTYIHHTDLPCLYM